MLAPHECRHQGRGQGPPWCVVAFSFSSLATVHSSHNIRHQRTLALKSSFGCTLADVVCIVGCAIPAPESFPWKKGSPRLCVVICLALSLPHLSSPGPLWWSTLALLVRGSRATSSPSSTCHPASTPRSSSLLLTTVSSFVISGLSGKSYCIHFFHCRQAYDEVLLDYFENTVFPAHLFENEDGWNVVLSTLPNNLRDTIAKAWQEDEELTPRDRWDQFFVAVNQAIVRSPEASPRLAPIGANGLMPNKRSRPNAGEGPSAKQQPRVRHRVHMHLPAVGHPGVQAPPPLAQVAVLRPPRHSYAPGLPLSLLLFL